MRQVIDIPQIILEWRDWCGWEQLKLDARMHREAVRLPKESGIYEVKYVDQEERLTIGKASNLRMRVKQALVKGNVPHSSGKRIRAEEDLDRIVVRWAVTTRPAAVEEELHQQYNAHFHKLPKHTKRT